MRTASVLVPLVTASSAAPRATREPPRDVSRAATRGDGCACPVHALGGAVVARGRYLPGARTTPASPTSRALREADEEIGLRAAAHALDVAATLPRS